MASDKADEKSRKEIMLREATEALKQLGFSPRQSNDVAGYVLLALLGLKPTTRWKDASHPLMGITPIIDYVAEYFGLRYAPNTRETIRDEAVKYFVEYGMVVRNPDNPSRPTNSGRTVYQMEPSALALFRELGKADWKPLLESYLANREELRRDLQRHRTLARIPVKLPDGKAVALSPGGQNPLIKLVVEEFCQRFVPGGVVVYIGDTENKFEHMETDYLAGLGITLDSGAKMPDVVVHDARRDWLVLIEAVTTAGPVDGKRRKELKELFAQARAGLVFVTAFETRRSMQSFLSLISWETEVWVAEAPDHLIHFNGERFLGPYADAMPQKA